MSEVTPIALTGNLTVREVPAIWRRYRQQADSGMLPETIDLKMVERTDSSALALLLEWQTLGGEKIKFENPPESLKVIARLTEVEGLLGWNNQNHKSDA